MKNKLTISLGILFILTLTQVPRVWAVTPISQKLQNEANHLQAVASRAATQQTAELSRIISTSNTMITTRITSLNNMITRVNNDTRLSSDEKTSMVTNINTEITNLQTLKAKIDADTDVTTARADRKSIVIAYRVYLIYEPQTRFSVIVDNLLTTTANLQGQLPQIQNLLNTLKSQGKDTTAMQATLGDMTTQLTNATTTLNGDKTTLAELTPSSTNYTTVFTGVKADFTKVRSDFSAVRADFTSLQKDLKALFGTTTTPIATPTATPTP